MDDLNNVNNVSEPSTETFYKTPVTETAENQTKSEVSTTSEANDPASSKSSVPGLIETNVSVSTEASVAVVIESVLLALNESVISVANETVSSATNESIAISTNVSVSIGTNESQSTEASPNKTESKNNSSFPWNDEFGFTVNVSFNIWNTSGIEEEENVTETLMGKNCDFWPHEVSQPVYQCAINFKNLTFDARNLYECCSNVSSSGMYS